MKGDLTARPADHLPSKWRMIARAAARALKRTRILLRGWALVHDLWPHALGQRARKPCRVAGPMPAGLTTNAQSLTQLSPTGGSATPNLTGSKPVLGTLEGASAQQAMDSIDSVSRARVTVLPGLRLLD